MIYKNINKTLLDTIILFYKNKYLKKIEIKIINDNDYELNISNDKINEIINIIIIKLEKFRKYINKIYDNKNNIVNIIYDKTILNILINYLNNNELDLDYNTFNVYTFDDYILKMNNYKIGLYINFNNKYKNKNGIIEINKYIDNIINDYNKIII